MKPCLKCNNNTNLTLHTVPSASPQTVSISVSHEQNNTIHLSWEPPPLDTHNGILQGYQVIHISSYDAISWVRSDVLKKIKCKYSKMLLFGLLKLHGSTRWLVLWDHFTIAATHFIIFYFTWLHLKEIHTAGLIFYLLLQVWCVESEEQQYQNWTVNSSQKKLDISALKPGKQYWITIAAVNGAGVGTPSDPHGFLISELNNTSSIISVMSPQ